jgi:hypothetical protein
MTDQLATLLDDEADGLPVPAPDVQTIMTSGRRLRHRRQSAIAIGCAAALAVFGAGLSLVLDQAGDRANKPDSDRGQVVGEMPDVAAFGEGSTIYLGDVAATVPNTVHSLHYTSAGVLVRSNARGGASDGSGPENLSLVSPEGEVTDLGILPAGQVGPATDPAQSVYVLAQPVGNGFEAVFYESTTGDEVRGIPLPDLPMSYWAVPPLALDGDVLYVGYKKSTIAINWRAGDEHEVPGMSGGAPSVAGGRAVIDRNDRYEVLDVETGATLLVVGRGTGAGALQLSPDGNFAALARGQDFQVSESATPRLEVYDVAKGTRIDRQETVSSSFGWTPAGTLFWIDGDTIHRCDPATGTCTSTSLAADLGKDPDLRLGGRVYDS